MKIQFVRHATLILYYNNKKILVDPILSSKGTISSITNVPDKRNNPLVDLPIPIDTIVSSDAVLITHTHRDHFDDVAVKVLPKDITIFCQAEDETKIREFGFTNVNSISDAFEWGNIKITRTRGKHGHGIIAMRMAPVSGFIISAPHEPSIYLMGDTVWCSCVDAALEKYKPDIIVSNCGEAKFSRGKAITMDAQDILSVCKKLPDAKVVAVHMEAWNHCRLTREALRDFAIQNNINDQVMIPMDGDTLPF